jgi:hypothetical protein
MFLSKSVNKFYRGQNKLKMWANFVIFKKKSPIGRKFAQSGHPGQELHKKP